MKIWVLFYFDRAIARTANEPPGSRAVVHCSSPKSFDPQTFKMKTYSFQGEQRQRLPRPLAPSSQGEQRQRLRAPPRQNLPFAQLQPPPHTAILNSRVLP